MTRCEQRKPAITADSLTERASLTKVLAESVSEEREVI